MDIQRGSAKAWNTHLGPFNEQQAAGECDLLQIPSSQLILGWKLEDSPHIIKILVVFGATKGKVEEAVRLMRGVTVTQTMPRGDSTSNRVVDDLSVVTEDRAPVCPLAQSRDGSEELFRVVEKPLRTRQTIFVQAIGLTLPPAAHIATHTTHGFLD